MPNKNNLFLYIWHMKVKLYLGTLFLIFIYFGASFQEQVAVITNQEIVLEFVDVKINKEDINTTIVNVKEKLLKIGVSNIKIEETKKGTLKISYHSFTDTDDIKELLSLDKQPHLNNDSENKENQNTISHYKIDIYEISNQTNISDFQDEYLFEIKVNSDRFTTNYKYLSVRSLETQKTDVLFKTAYKATKNNPFTKDYTSYYEPEVRAGPQKAIS